MSHRPPVTHQELAQVLIALAEAVGLVGLVVCLSLLLWLVER